MDEYTTDPDGLSPEGEDEADLPEAEGDTVSRKAYERAVNQVRKLKSQVRRADLSLEYGPEIAERVPDELPVEKWPEYATKLKERLGTTATTSNDEGTEPPATPAAAQPSEQERRAAALAREGTRGAGSGSISRDEWLNLANTDPAAAQAAFAAGRVAFSGLREGLGPDR